MSLQDLAMLDLEVSRNLNTGDNTQGPYTSTKRDSTGQNQTPLNNRMKQYSVTLRAENGLQLVTVKTGRRDFVQLISISTMKSTNDAHVLT